MAKKVTVISTSIRPNSNSELLAKSFAEGAEAAGNEVTFITLKDKDIRFSNLHTVFYHCFCCYFNIRTHGIPTFFVKLRVC